jgi:hypothetical protein
MKKIFMMTMVAAVAVTAFSCGRAKKAAADAAAAVSGVVGQVTGTGALTDSIRILPEAGAIVSEVYSGTIPAASASEQKMRLTLYHQEKSTFGVYHLTTTYVKAGDATDPTVETTGSWTTVAGENYPIFVLTDYVTREEMSFISHGSGIDMLDQNRQPIASKLNYTLTPEAK